MRGVAELAVAVAQLRSHAEDSSDRDDLTHRLYASWYAAPVAAVDVPRHFPVDLVQVLRAATAGAEAWEDGWVAVHVAGSGQLVARRGAEARLLERCDYLGRDRVGVLPRPGDVLQVTSRRERVDADGAWWRTAGAGWLFSRPSGELVRVFWNLDLAGLPVLVRLLTDRLASDRRWMLKCAARPEVHSRADASVLYLPMDAVESLAPVVDEAAAAVAVWARPGAPPLTLPIAAGVAVAVDPGSGESFGESRCRMVVDALAQDVPADVGEAVALVQIRMAQSGVSAARPWDHRPDGVLPWER